MTVVPNVLFRIQNPLLYLSDRMAITDSDRYIISSGILVFNILGLFGNLNVIYAHYRLPALRTRYGILLTLLCTSQSICLLTELINAVYGLSKIPVIRSSCFLIISIGVFMHCAQTGLMATISVDLFISIVFPLRADWAKKTKIVHLPPPSSPCIRLRHRMIRTLHYLVILCLPTLIYDWAKKTKIVHLPPPSSPCIRLRHRMIRTLHYLVILCLPTLIYGIVVIIIAIVHMDSSIIPLCNPPLALPTIANQVWYFVAFCFGGIHKGRKKGKNRTNLRFLGTVMANVMNLAGVDPATVGLVQSYNVFSAMICYSSSFYVCFFRSSEYRRIFWFQIVRVASRLGITVDESRFGSSTVSQEMLSKTGQGGTRTTTKTINPSVVHLKMRGGTIHINSHFDDNVMAETIEKAMRSGDKEKVVLQLLQINNIQRQMLRTPYKTRYGKDLEEAIAKALGVKQCMLYSDGLKEEVRDCKKESSHNVDFHGCYYAFNYPNSTTLALETQGTCGSYVCASGKDDCTVTSSKQRNGGITTTMLCCCYTELRTLDEAVAADTSGDYKKLLLTLLQGIRDEGHHADSVRVRQAIDILSAPAEKKDKHEKYAVLGAANFHELAQILDGVQKKTGKSLEEQIKKECSGDFKEAVIVLYRIASMGKPRFFADQINAAVKGFGTNSKDLIRILVSRSEIDLEDIKDVYAAVHGKRLDDTIKEECKGAYQHALLELVRGNKSLA
uniref:Annexin n=1 Tax=Pristionchus pacificus TaxID=54126 RepID=A0A2A6B4A0_PRIPA|eukprot:PDM60683.1 G protein-coupled receptor [Pristionchus pacificus]